MDRPDEVEVTKVRIRQLLEKLSEDDLLLVERFVISTHRQASGQGAAMETGTETAPCLYPAVFVPAAALDKLVGIVSVGGDALADSEALYDEI